MATDPISTAPVLADDAVSAPAAPRRAPGPRPEQLSQTDRLWMFWEANKRLVLTLAAALVVAVLGVVAFLAWRASKNDEATDKLADSVALFETGQFEQALRSDGARAGLKDIADTYGGTKAGNLAQYYAASALYELKRYDEAATYFKAFDGDGTLLGPSADAGLAAILENQNKPADAADSPLFTPMHLLSAARAYLAAKRPDDARRVLERIEADYAESPEAQDVAFMLGQADALAPATPAR